MERNGSGLTPDFVPLTSEAIGKLEVLKVEEVVLVESTEIGEKRAPNQETSADERIAFVPDSRAGIGGGAIVGEGQRGDKMDAGPVALYDRIAIVEDDAGAHGGRAGFHKGIHHAAKAIRGEVDIVIHYQYEL